MSEKNGHGRVGKRGRGFVRLPGEIEREIDDDVVDDPMWYVGRVGPSVEDVLDADDDEVERLRASVRQAALPSDSSSAVDGNGNGTPASSRRRRPRLTRRK